MEIDRSWHLSLGSLKTSVENHSQVWVKQSNWLEDPDRMPGPRWQLDLTLNLHDT